MKQPAPGTRSRQVRAMAIAAALMIGCAIAIPVVANAGIAEGLTVAVPVQTQRPHVAALSSWQRAHWYSPGSTFTLRGSTLKKITKVTVSGTPAGFVSRSGSAIRMRVPGFSAPALRTVSVYAGTRLVFRGKLHVSDYRVVTDPITIGPFPTTHVQGLAVDEQRGFIYYSMTTMFVKTDLRGKVLGTITGLDAHLGDLTLNAETGEVYGTLEYDAQRAWTVGIFDGPALTTMNADAEDSGLIDTVTLEEVAKDWDFDVDGDGVVDGDFPDSVDHRYGTAGVDGIAFGPSFATGEANTLTVAYGIYANKLRNDNDNQVLLQYDISDWAQYRHPLNQRAIPRTGPSAPEGKYFVRTGNTNWGVQNLVYDQTRGIYMMSVYRSQKRDWPHYGMFAVKASSTPIVKDDGREFLPLAKGASTDAPTGVTGWSPRNPYGLFVLADGTWLVNSDSGVTGKRYATTRRFQFEPRENNPLR